MIQLEIWWLNKEEKRLTKNWPDILVSVDKSTFISIVSISAIGILRIEKKDKEYLKCLLIGNHHNLVFKNRLVFLESLTKVWPKFDQ